MESGAGVYQLFFRQCPGFTAPLFGDERHLAGIKTSCWNCTSSPCPTIALRVRNNAGMVETPQLADYVGIGGAAPDQGDGPMSSAAANDGGLYSSRGL